MAITDTATSPTRHPITLIYDDGEDISDMEVIDPVSITDRLEQVDVGGGGVLHGTYLRLSGPDLVAAAEALRRLADRIIDAVLDARQLRAEAAQRECWCGTRIDADEDDCGAARCSRWTAQDHAGLVP